MYRTSVRRGLSVVVASAALGVLAGGTAVADESSPTLGLPGGSVDVGYCGQDCPEDELNDPLGLFWIFDLGSSYIGSS